LLLHLLLLYCLQTNGRSTEVLLGSPLHQTFVKFLLHVFLSIFPGDDLHSDFLDTFRALLSGCCSFGADDASHFFNFSAFLLVLFKLDSLEFSRSLVASKGFPDIVFAILFIVHLV